MKMMQLDEAILREHYAHLVDKPFFPSIVESMTASPVIVMCLKGVDVVSVFREMTGVTNGRKAAPRHTARRLLHERSAQHHPCQRLC